MKRFHRIVTAQLEDAGRAVVLNMEHKDRTVERLEVAREDIGEFFKALFAASQAMGERSPTNRALEATGPADAVHVPAEELHAVSKGRALWLFVRVGSEDLGIAFPDPRAARALADGLQEAIASSGRT